MARFVELTINEKPIIINESRIQEVFIARDRNLQEDVTCVEIEGMGCCMVEEAYEHIRELLMDT